jgi:hypothetical protein
VCCYLLLSGGDVRDRSPSLASYRLIAAIAVLTVGGLVMIYSATTPPRLTAISAIATGLGSWKTCAEEISLCWEGVGV